MSQCVNYLILVMQYDYIRYQHVGKLEKCKVRMLYDIFQNLCKVWDHFKEKRKNLLYNFRKKKKIRKMTF